MKKLMATLAVLTTFCFTLFGQQLDRHYGDVLVYGNIRVLANPSATRYDSTTIPYLVVDSIKIGNEVLKPGQIGQQLSFESALTEIGGTVRWNGALTENVVITGNGTYSVELGDNGNIPIADFSVWTAGNADIKNTAQAGLHVGSDNNIKLYSPSTAEIDMSTGGNVMLRSSSSDTIDMSSGINITSNNTMDIRTTGAPIYVGMGNTSQLYFGSASDYLGQLYAYTNGEWHYNSGNYFNIVNGSGIFIECNNVNGAINLTSNIHRLIGLSGNGGDASLILMATDSLAVVNSGDTGFYYSPIRGIEYSNINMTNASDSTLVTKGYVDLFTGVKFETGVKDFYVSEASGNDVTGDGSVDNPYQTLDAMLSTFAKSFTDATYTIHVDDGNYSISNYYYFSAKNSTLNIVGSYDTIVSGISGIIPDALDGQHLTIGGSRTADALLDMFVQKDATTFYPILKSGTDDIWVSTKTGTVFTAITQPTTNITIPTVSAFNIDFEGAGSILEYNSVNVYIEGTATFSNVSRQQILNSNIYTDALCSNAINMDGNFLPQNSAIILQRASGTAITLKSNASGTNSANSLFIRGTGTKTGIGFALSSERWQPLLAVYMRNLERGFSATSNGAVAELVNTTSDSRFMDMSRMLDIYYGAIVFRRIDAGTPIILDNVDYAVYNRTTSIYSNTMIYLPNGTFSGTPNIGWANFTNSIEIGQNSYINLQGLPLIVGMDTVDIRGQLTYKGALIDTIMPDTIPNKAYVDNLVADNDSVVFSEYADTSVFATNATYADTSVFAEYADTANVALALANVQYILTDTLKTTYIHINDSVYVDTDGSINYTGETFFNGMYGTTNNGAEGAMYTYTSDNGDTAFINLYTLDADAQQMSILIDRSGIYYDQGTVPDTFGENHLITKRYLAGLLELDSIPVEGATDSVNLDMQSEVEKVFFTSELDANTTVILSNNENMRTLSYNVRVTGSVILTFGGMLNWLCDDPDWDNSNKQYTLTGTSLTHYEISILKVTFSGVDYYKIKFSGEQI